MCQECSDGGAGTGVIAAPTGNLRPAAMAATAEDNTRKMRRREIMVFKSAAFRRPGDPDRRRYERGVDSERLWIAHCPEPTFRLDHFRLTHFPEATPNYRHTRVRAVAATIAPRIGVPFSFAGTKRPRCRREWFHERNTAKGPRCCCPSGIPRLPCHRGERHLT
jgi:hypothetical protein